MTLHQLTTALAVSSSPGDTFAAALAPFPLHEDDPNAGSEAEYWLDVCHEQCNIPLVNDPKARAILAVAARLHEMTGFNQRLYRFHDESKLLISQVVEAVL
jgi:hypothetical protein